jgi:hypothetical protein
MEAIMRKSLLLLAAGVIALSPNAMFAKPGGGGGGGHGSTMSQGHMSQPTTHSGQGSTHGTGWDHMNGPTSTGQPGVECEETRPGRSSSAPGSAFNEEGKAGTRYAGEQPQNSRNTASISQYDVACIHQPQH